MIFAALFKLAAQNSIANLEFVENKGQWDSRVRFKGELPNGAIFLQKNGFTVVLHKGEDLALMGDNHRSRTPSNQSLPKNKSSNLPAPTQVPAPPQVMHSHAYQVTFKGANSDPDILPDKPLPNYNNYFIGKDPSRWKGDCRIYQGITYQNIYPHIDLRYYTASGRLKYDIVVHPGGDISQIAMIYEGVNSLSVKGNELLIHTSVGDVKELAPYSYQPDEKGGRRQLDCKYVITNGNTVQLKIKNYSPDAELIIDPTLVFSTFTGSKSSNWGFTATPGPDGSFYAGGIVFGSEFPVSTGAFQQEFKGGIFDVGIMKFNSKGTNRVYATYLGGSDDETPHSMYCDAQGRLVVIGRTYSTDFPFLVRKGIGGKADLFVLKLTAGGDALIGSMLIGGNKDDCVNVEDQFRNNHEQAESLIRNYGDDSRSEVIMDGANNIYVAASSQSATDFPGNSRLFSTGIWRRRTGWHPGEDQSRVQRYYFCQFPGRQR